MTDAITAAVNGFIANGNQIDAAMLMSNRDAARMYFERIGIIIPHSELVEDAPFCDGSGKIPHIQWKMSWTPSCGSQGSFRCNKRAGPQMIKCGKAISAQH